MKKVFIGVGHGGSDPGAIGLNGIKEKDCNLDISLAARKELERHGIVVLLSRIKDENDPLSDEIAEGNRFKPDLAVDFHNNAAGSTGGTGSSGGSGGNGFEVYHQVRGGLSLATARAIENEVKLIGQNSRGVKTKLQADGRDWFGFLRQINSPALLCEFAFVDSADVYIIDTPIEREVMGIAAAKGILKALGVQWKAPASAGQKYIWSGKYTSENAKKYAEMIRALPGKPYCEVRDV